MESPHNEIDLEEIAESYSQQNIRDLIDYAYIMDSSGFIVSEGRFIENELGFEEGEREGIWSYEHVHPEDREEVMKQMMEEGETESTYRIKTPDGEFKRLRVRQIGDKFKAGDQEYSLLLHNMIDEVEESRMEEELNKEFIRHIGRNSLNVAQGLIKLAQETEENEETLEKAFKTLKGLEEKIETEIKEEVGRKSVKISQKINYAENDLEEPNSIDLRKSGSYRVMAGNKINEVYEILSNQFEGDENVSIVVAPYKNDNIRTTIVGNANLDQLKEVSEDREIPGEFDFQTYSLNDLLDAYDAEIELGESDGKEYVRIDLERDPFENPRDISLKNV